VKAVRIFCHLCNKGLSKDLLTQQAGADQRNFMIKHLEETDGKHNSFGVELGIIDLYGAYLKAQDSR